MNVAYNVDCMEYMRTLPDKAFDLAVVDPPYGGGGGTPSRARSVLAGDSTVIGTISRTGGAWAAKYGKKLLPGTTRQAKSISMSCFAYPSNRSFGAAIILACHRAAAS